MAGKRKATEADIDSEGGRMTRSRTANTPGPEVVVEEDEGLTFADTIDVLVGPEGRRFGVPKHLVQLGSGFFDGAIRFNEQNKKGDKPIELIDDRPKHSTNISTVEVDLATDEWFLQGLVNTCVLADKIRDQRAADKMIGKILNHVLTLKPESAALLEAWNLAPQKSTLRQLIVDVFVIEQQPEWVKYWLDSEDFPGDLARAIGQRYAALAIDMQADWLERTRDHRLRFANEEDYYRDSELNLDFARSVERP
ncbi:hypothetical protein LTR17_018807 [Elasticomyces elasticus]|nr:hypothetical protein LTR17_018807 [Elasticomyces elasticus]